MNKDILNIILNDVLYNDINSIKKISLINKDFHMHLQPLMENDKIQSKKKELEWYELSIQGVKNDFLCRAAEAGHIDIVEKMLEIGADRDGDRYELSKGISAAARGGNIEIIELLAGKLKKPKSQHNNSLWNEAMQNAAKKGHINVVKFIIEKEEFQNIDWNRALRAAAKGFQVDMCKFFIEKGADDLSSQLYYFRNNIEMLEYFFEVIHTFRRDNEPIGIDVYDLDKIIGFSLRRKIISYLKEQRSILFPHQ